jgi:hypothetical protein
MRVRKSRTYVKRIYMTMYVTYRQTRPDQNGLSEESMVCHFIAEVFAHVAHMLHQALHVIGSCSPW